MANIPYTLTVWAFLFQPKSMGFLKLALPAILPPENSPPLMMRIPATFTSLDGILMAPSTAPSKGPGGDTSTGDGPETVESPRTVWGKCWNQKNILPGSLEIPIDIGTLRKMPSVLNRDVMLKCLLFSFQQGKNFGIPTTVLI